MAEIMINPCPVCGEPVMVEDIGGMFMVRCLKCGHNTNTCYPYVNTAVWEWNQHTKKEKEEAQPPVLKLEAGARVIIPPSGKLSGVVARIDPDGSCLVKIQQLVRFNPKQAMKLNIVQA